MAAYQSFEELPIWQESRERVRLIYRLTKQEECSKDFGLKDQIQRAGVSIMTNIAKGSERRSTKESQQFLNYSKASSAEARSLSYVSLDQSYITEDQFRSVYEQTLTLSKSIAGFDHYLSQSGR